MIRSLIFDLGGVLLNYDIEADTRALAEAGLPEYSAWGSCPGLGQIANLYLNGLMTEEGFCKRIDPFCRPGTSDAAKLHSMQAVLSDIPESRLKVLRKLREKYRIYLLSNINHLSWKYSLEQFENAGISPDECFDKVFLSFEMGIAKPDPAIFRRILKDTGAKAGETLFLDDSTENIAAATASGIQTYRVPMNTPEEILKALLEGSGINTNDIEHD